MKKCFRLMAAGTLLVFLIAAVLPMANGQDDMAKPDLRVRKLLELLKLKYTLTDNGNYRVEFKIEDAKRGHWVFVSSRTETYNNLETRKIWATACKLKEKPSEKLANELLMENVKQKLGGWEVAEREDGYRIIYSARLPTEIAEEGFRDAMRIVLFTADKMEERLTEGKDEF